MMCVLVTKILGPSPPSKPEVASSFCSTSQTDKKSSRKTQTAKKPDDKIKPGTRQSVWEPIGDLQNDVYARLTQNQMSPPPKPTLDY
jgi:hypothetical protein